MQYFYGTIANVATVMDQMYRKYITKLLNSVIRYT